MLYGSRQRKKLNEDERIKIDFLEKVENGDKKGQYTNQTHKFSSDRLNSAISTFFGL